MSTQTVNLSKLQMTRLADALTTTGWPVEFTSEDETDVPCDWDETVQDYVCPQVCSINWGDWIVYDSGELHFECNEFAVADCDAFAFLAAVHTAWHAVTQRKETA